MVSIAMVEVDDIIVSTSSYFEISQYGDSELTPWTLYSIRPAPGTIYVVVIVYKNVFELM